MFRSFRVGKKYKEINANQRMRNTKMLASTRVCWFALRPKSKLTLLMCSKNCLLPDRLNRKTGTINFNK